MKLNATTIARRACELQVRARGELNITQMRDAQSAIFEAVYEAGEKSDWWCDWAEAVANLAFYVGRSARKRRAHEAMAAKRDTIIKMHLLVPPEKIKAKRRK